MRLLFFDGDCTQAILVCRNGNKSKPDGIIYFDRRFG
jgi:hypothetical protein